MTPDQIRAKHQEVVDRHGPWTAHNFEIFDGFFTMDNTTRWFEGRAEYFVYLAEEALKKRTSEQRVLDVGCLEGGIATFFAKFGAEAVGLEIRDTHLAKANFAKEAMGLDRLSFVQGDMLRIDEYDLGMFDVIVCAGVLYHVDAPDLEPFLASLRRICRGILIIDTHVALEIKEKFDLPDGPTLYGRSIVEHPDHARAEETKAKKVWASADTDYSFWVTERSLVNLLNHVGFASVTRPLYPMIERPWKDRGYWIAHAEKFSSQHVGWRMLPAEDKRPAEHEMFGEKYQQDVRNPNTLRVGEIGR